MANRMYGDWDPQTALNLPDQKEITKNTTNMVNDPYANLLNKYLMCVNLYFADFELP